MVCGPLISIITLSHKYIQDRPGDLGSSLLKEVIEGIFTD